MNIAILIFFKVFVNEPRINENIEVDQQKLASYLEKLYYVLKKELDNNHSQAFEEYRLHKDLDVGSSEILQNIESKKHPNKVISY